MSNLTSLKDELVGLNGEDQIAAFLTMLARKLVSDWPKEGKTKLSNSMSFGRGNPNNPAAVADYSVTFASLFA